MPSLNSPIGDQPGMNQLRPMLLKEWPNLKHMESLDNFWKYQWNKHGWCTYSNISTYFNTTLALKGEHNAKFQSWGERVGLFIADIFQNYLGGRLGLVGNLQLWEILPSPVVRGFVLMGMGMWPLLINTRDLRPHTTRGQGNGVYCINTKLSLQIKQYCRSEIIKAIKSQTGFRPHLWCIEVQWECCKRWTMLLEISFCFNFQVELRHCPDVLENVTKHRQCHDDVIFPS